MLHIGSSKTSQVIFAECIHIIEIVHMKTPICLYSCFGTFIIFFNLYEEAKPAKIRKKFYMYENSEHL